MHLSVLRPLLELKVFTSSVLFVLEVSECILTKGEEVVDERTKSVRDAAEEMSCTTKSKHLL